MGRRGPKPTPTALKLLRGNPGKRRIDPDEPRLPGASPAEAPDWLCPEARTVWDRLAPLLATAGLLTEADVTTLARYCDMTARWHKAREWFHHHAGEFGGLGFPIRNQAGQVVSIQTWPQTTEYHRLAQQLLRIEQEFGFTPSARTRVVGRQPGPPVDSFEAFLRRRHG